MLSKKKTKKILVLIMAIAASVIALSYDKNNYIDKYLTKFQNIGIVNGAKMAWTKVSTSIAEKISDYETDEIYWKIESNDTREKYPIRKIQIGSGLIDNHITDKDFNKYPTSFQDMWNTKSIEIKGFKPNRNISTVWIYESNNIFGSQMQPIYHNNGILVADGENQLTKLNAKNGNVEWMLNYPRIRVAKRGAIVGKIGYDEVVYFAAGSTLRAVNYLTGKPIVKFGKNGVVQLDDEMLVAPRIMENSNIIAVTLNANIVIIDGKNGKIKKRDQIRSKSEPKRAGDLKSVYSSPRVWGGVAIDNARKILFITTSNPAPVLIGVDRPGKNKYSSSILAYDLENMEVLWDFQDVSHDLWDLDIGAPPVLAVLTNIEGEKTDVVVAVTKSGNVYVINRENGESIFDIHYKRTPSSRVRGEKTSIFQPQSTKPMNLIGELNTKTLKDGKWISGYYDPPRVGEPIILKGLHGGVIWPGFAVRGNELIGAVSIDESILELTEISNESIKTNLNIPECMGCHNDVLMPKIANFIGTRTKSQLEELLKNGFQSMPALPLTSDRLDEIVDLLANKLEINETDDTGIGPQKVIRKPYRKYIESKNEPAYMVKIDISNGRTIWKRSLSSSPGLALAGPVIINKRYGVVTGANDRRFLIFDMNDGSDIISSKMEFNGSGSPLIFEMNDLVYAVVPSTGSSTMNLYDKRQEIGNLYYLFEIGKIIYN